jgi:ferredoxin-NADP reductase
VAGIGDGEVSPYLTGELRPGDQIELHVRSVATSSGSRPTAARCCWSGGGSVLAPLMSMMRLRAAVRSDVDTRLLVSSRRWDDTIFRDEFERLNGNGLMVVHTLIASQPPGWAGHSRRVDAEMLAQVGPGPAERPLVFVCGPTPFVESVAEALVGLGHQPQAIRTEMLDGNAVAGVLGEVFAVEMTTAIMTCGNCGAAGPAGATHVFRGAGIVLRCAQCDNALVKIVEGGTRMWFDFGGLRSVEITP